MRIIYCSICGREVDQKNTRVARRYHPECKHFANSYSALMRASEAVHPTREKAVHLRRMMWVIGNRFSADQPREKNGRFKKVPATTAG